MIRTMKRFVERAGSLAAAPAAAIALAVTLPARADAQSSGPATAAQPSGSEAAESTASPPAAFSRWRFRFDPPGLKPFDLSGGQAAQVTSARSFNPAISVIPDISYYSDNESGHAFDLLSSADGFHGAGAGEAHAHGGGIERGFNLRELEVTFSGSVDPYFDVWASLAIAPGEIDIEEAYFQTRRFLPGFQVRAGRFLSGVGYINRQHPHQWDFVDQALPYDLLFGGNLGEVGVQVTYLPTLPVYVQLGFEALQGDNEAVASQLGPEAGAFFGEKPGPRLLTGFAKVSPELGYSSTLQVGFSAGKSRLHQEAHDEDEDGTMDEAFEGGASFWGTDVVYRYDSGQQYGRGDLTLQAEYLRRIRDLDLLYESGDVIPAGPAFRFVQDGFYAQAVYGFAPRWTAGFRFEVAGLVNGVEVGGSETSLDASSRYSFNATFNPTEFSRLRVQFTRGSVASGGERDSFNQLWVQFQMSLGAHGAHSF